MKKLSMIVLMSLATAGHAFAGGLNQAAVDTPVEEPIAVTPVAGGGMAVVGGLLLLAALAGSTTATTTTAP